MVAEVVKERVRPTGAQIAENLGISRAAVSYALNGREGVSLDLRRQILAEAQRLGLPIRASRRAERPLLGLVLADVGNQFYSELAVSASDAARKLGAEVLLSHTADEEEAIRSTVEVMLEHGVSGIILTVASAKDASLMPLLRAAGVPCVQVSRKSAHFNGYFVGIDDYHAGHEVMSHIISHGYEDICIAVGPLTSSSSALRAQGMIAAAREAGIVISRERILHTRLSADGGIAVADYLLRQGSRLPQAVVCGADVIALALISIFHDLGVQCPQDIAVTGYDGLLSSLSRIVGLTTVIQPRSEMAHTAVRMLLQNQHGVDHIGTDVICHHELFIGRTCGCP
ncbi:LacI family DNA-binding transcriptional regulator [Schaalia sp. Marseille-Q2122]|uniref:LacI family DNA-binding transcriptional regulator n=1 Tax=Schaalia sp. Marseille-Q2122 TaxID=2736604 RepID=UPI00158ACD27|nr:LacI family DNA-binding transcriptional regulator [Schaalia sp. Marseille-Q2122]